MSSLYRVEKTNMSQLHEQQNRGEKKPSPPKKKKLSFKSCKKNTVKSLHEVEHFLRNFNHFVKYVKLYNILK